MTEPPLLVGVDLAEVPRIEAMIASHGERFLSRCFTQRERAYCDANPRRRAEHYAARFAAKEAALKALGTGWSGGIAWTDVEVVRPPDGAPSIATHGAAARLADELGVRGWRLSVSHGAGLAIATAIAWLGCPGDPPGGES
ncbi:MAG: holo-ACP synthase [Phycisphaerales bacterium]